MYKEGITKLEFSMAIASLTAFARVDLGSLNTLYDLSEVGSCVGRGLRIVTLALGEEKNHRGTPVSGLVGDIRYLNRSDSESRYSYLVVTTEAAGLIQKWNSPDPIDRSDPSYNNGHWVFFPTDLSMENLKVETFLLRAVVGPGLDRYNLRRDLQPEVVQVQVQGYAHILQQSLKDLIPTFTPPNS